MDNRLIAAHLCHKIFIGSPDGKKLLAVLKEIHTSIRIFPCDTKTLEKHGGPAGWAAFLAGRLDFLLGLESMATEYDQKVIANSNKKDN